MGQAPCLLESQTCWQSPGVHHTKPTQNWFHRSLPLVQFNFLLGFVCYGKEQEMKVSKSCQDSCFEGKYWLSFFADSIKSAILTSTSAWFYYRSLMFVWQNIDDLSNVR